MIKRIPINIIDIRYLASMVLILVASIKKRRSQIENVAIALFIWWLALGWRSTAFVGASIVVNLGLLWMTKLNEYQVTALNILNLYIYKIFGRYIEPEIHSTYDASGVLMILVVKMGYLVKKFDRNLNNVLDYIFFVPGLLAGPCAPYNEFIAKNRMVDIEFPYQDMKRTLVYLAIHGILRTLQLKTEILRPTNSFFRKMVCFYLFNVCGRTRFHFAWNFSHCCFTLYNLPEYLNIDFYKVEFTESVREISLYWNRFISTWVKTLFFIPLKETSVLKAVTVSHLASAALHGINPCYLIFFLSFAMYSKPVSFVNTLLKYKILRQIQMLFFVSYFSIPFYLLDVSELFKVWKSVYFYGHIYFTLLMIWYWACRLLKGPDAVRERPILTTISPTTKSSSSDNEVKSTSIGPRSKSISSGSALKKSATPTSQNGKPKVSDFTTSKEKVE